MFNNFLKSIGLDNLLKNDKDEEPTGEVREDYMYEDHNR
jgi:hypothetical protein